MLTHLRYCVLITLASLFAIDSPRTLQAQEPRTPRFQNPLIRVWFPTTLLEDHQNFLDEIRKELRGETETQQRYDPIPESAELPAVRHEGLLVYLDPIGDADPAESRACFPGNRWLKPIRFLAVANREEFEKIVRERTGVDRDVPKGVLKASDDLFEFIPHERPAVRENSWTNYLEHVNRFWRYQNGFAFFADDAGLLTAELPQPDTLKLSNRASKRDLLAHVDFDAVSSRRKSRFWNEMRRRLEKVLQQHDDENQIDYAFRRGWGDVQLHLLRAVTNDLRTVRLSVEFASADKPAEIQLELTARPETDLGTYLGKTSFGTRELIAAIEQPAILTIASGWELPRPFANFLEKSIALANKELACRAGFNADVFLATDELTAALQASLAEAREFVIKLSRSPEGFTLYGGIRLSQAQRVSKSLEYLLNSLTTTNGTGVIQSEDASGRTYLSYNPSQLSEIVPRSSRERFPAEVHLTVVDSVLWFSFGPSDSRQVLTSTIDRSARLAPTAGRSRAAALLIDVALDRCLVDEKSTGGFDRVPHLAVRQLLDRLPRRRAEEVTFDFAPLLVENPVMEKRDDSVEKFLRELALEEADIDFTRPMLEPQSDPLPRFDDDLEGLEGIFHFNGEWNNSVLNQSLSPTRSMDPGKFLKPNLSGLRTEIRTDSNRFRLKLTAGSGLIKHLYGRMSHADSLIFHSRLLWVIPGSGHGVDIDFETFSPDDADQPY